MLLSIYMLCKFCYPFFMKFLLKIFILLLIIQNQSFANIDKIQSDYVKQMESAETNWQMKTYTSNATTKFNEESDKIYKSLAEQLDSNQIQILKTNDILWKKYLNSSQKSTIEFLYKKQGTIYQTFAISNIYSQALTHAILLQYLQPNSKIIPCYYISHDLTNCLNKSQTTSEICNCYKKEINLYKVNINENLNKISTTISTQDLKKINSAQIAWESYLNHTKVHLFKIIDEQNNEDKEIKKYQILFLLYQCRNSELANISF